MDDNALDENLLDENWAHGAKRAVSQHAQISDGTNHDIVHGPTSSQKGHGANHRGRGVHRAWPDYSSRTIRPNWPPEG